MNATYVDHVRAARVRGRALTDLARIKELHARLASLGPNGDAATALRVTLKNTEREIGRWYYDVIVRPQLTKEDASATDDERAVEMGLTAFKVAAYYVKNGDRANPSLNGVDATEAASADGNVKNAFLHDCAVKSLNMFDKSLLGGL